MKELINQIKFQKLKFIKNNLFITKIKETIKNFFPKLNKEDINVLEILTIFTVDFISFKYGFENKNDYYLQWEQNNCSDIKGVILLLLPFIDDKNNSYLLKKITDLNHMIYSKSEKFIPKEILELNRDDILSTHFKYGNMGIGLLPFYESPKDKILLQLYNETNNEKLIYKVIEDNFYGLLQTLEIINGKSYINWVNIQPLNLNNYHESNIYKNTNKYFDDDINEKKLQTIDLDYAGLWLGDFYNVIKNKYFEDGVKLKWLFFPYDLEPKGKYLIQILNELINLEEIINSEFNDFDDLNETDQLIFEKNTKNALNTKLNIDVNISVISSTIYWIVNNDRDVKKIIKENEYIEAFIKKKIEEDNDNDDDEEDVDVKDVETVKLAFKFIIENHLNLMWNYLRQSIQKLIASSYGKFLIKINDEKKYIISTDYKYKPLSENIVEKFKKEGKDIIQLNIKNIYNVAKSLSHMGKKPGEWNKKLDKNYISLDKDYRYKFFNNIFKDTDWFKINQNYRREIRFNPKKINKPEEIDNDYEIYKMNILNDFKNYFIIIVFEELVTSGILNKFVPNIEITDKTKLPQDTSSLQKKRKSLIKKMFKKNKNDWEESYYYLTNNKFKYINKMKISKDKQISENDKYDEKEYFDVIADKQEWTTFYAMNWISQISFFQHYIFHQVIYVTGATGQGKSTQVPKLLLYACKMYDYNSKGNVICTQPRITPTIENALRIAEELGLPIEEVSNNSIVKIKTNNYNVQYKYEGGEHSKSHSDYLTLKIVTDGSLLEIMKSNPTLKKNNKFNEVTNKNENVINQIRYTNNNYYDIIIVDEAHEHNINMDIIIALGKQSCYFNNQVKLIIVSATMDDDEPIYRSYFKIINDKLLFPIKSIIYNPFFPNKLLLLNPIHMDRRYHISPPGETTQYKVTEVYLDNDVDLKTERENAKKVQELGYNKVIEICNKSSSGEILFFCTGKNEILEAVEYLNNVMPPGNIALPFFSEMNKTYQEIITKINSKIYNIKNRRENIHLEWNENYIEDLSVPAGLYKRSVIIATNIAEASVTIPGLAFVVDNGYAKENSFSNQLNISKLIVDKISESSRLQRKGRVGRVSDGTVYYMYKKDARKNIKPKYKITQQDITDMVINLCTNLNLKLYLEDTRKYKYQKLIASEFLNPNLPKIKRSDEEYINNSYPVVTKLYDLYELNYKINDDYLSYDYFLEDYEKYKNIDSSLLVNDDGQLFDNLLDNSGSFYLIHPYENIIKRNICNNIISIDNKKINNIPIINYKYFLKSLIDKNLIIDLNADSLYLYKSDIIKQNRVFVKTELANYIMKLKKDFDLLNMSESVTLLAASAMGCLNEVLEIRLFLDLITNLPSNLLNENINWDQYKKIHTCFENDSDILFIYNIIKKLKSRFSNLSAFNINNSVNNKIDTYVNDQVKIFKDLTKKSKEPPKDYDGKKWNKLRNLEINGTLTLKKKELFLSESSTIDFIFNDIKNSNKEIETWAENNYFNPKIIIEFIKKLASFNLNKIDKYNNNETILWSKNFTPNFNKCLTDSTIEEKILRSFVYGNPIQYTFYVSNKLATIINFSLYNVDYAIPYSSKNSTIDSFASVDDFIFYLKYEQVDNLENVGKDTVKISILNKIKPKWLIPALPLVHNSTFNNIIQETKDNTSIIYFLDSYMINKLNKEFTNNWSKDNFIWDLSDEKVAPIMHYYYKTIIKVINKLTK